jgi:hypothetical protein
MKNIDHLEVKSIEYVYNPDAMKEWIRLYVKSLLEMAIEEQMRTEKEAPVENRSIL